MYVEECVRCLLQRLRNMYKKRECVKLGCKIGNSVRISHKAKIGRNCEIGNHTRVSGTVILDSGVKLGSGGYFENICVGKNSVLEGSIVITGKGSGRITIGRECYIGHHTALDFSSDINIGNHVHVAGLSSGFWTHTSYKMCILGIDLGMESSEVRELKPIKVEDNVYIGGNCTIYPGVTIGNHSIIAPNSAVTKDVPPYSMYGGVPAKFIKTTRDMIVER